MELVTPSNLSFSEVLLERLLMSTAVRDGSCFWPITMAWYLLCFPTNYHNDILSSLLAPNCVH